MPRDEAALDALRATYPATEISYLGSPWHGRLLPGRPGPWDRVRVVPPHPGLHGAPVSAPASPDLAAFLARERRYGYDLAVQLHGGGGQSNPLVSGLGARVSAGARNRDAARPLDAVRHHQHEILRFLGWSPGNPTGHLEPPTLTPPTTGRVSPRSLAGPVPRRGGRRP